MAFFEMNIQYTPMPFIIQAATIGCIETYEAVRRANPQKDQLGTICISEKFRNYCISNTIAAAAMHGHKYLLRHILE